MVFRDYTPSYPLSNYVENIIYYEGYSAEHSVDKLLPDGSISIIIDMEDTPKKLYRNENFNHFTEYRESYISGQHREFMHIDAQVSSMMVIRFHIGGAWKFFDFPMSDLNDKVQQLENYYGESIGIVRKKIISENDIDAKFLLIEKYLLEKIRNNVEENPALTTAIKELTNNHYPLTTKNLAQKAGISQKHLINLFDKKVGLTPKALARIFRFQKVIQKIEETKKIDWTELAYECGYYDQSHFIKDFYAFCGIKPSDYPNQRGEFLNYLP